MIGLRCRLSLYSGNTNPTTKERLHHEEQQDAMICLQEDTVNESLQAPVICLDRSGPI